MRYSPELEAMVVDLAESVQIPNPEDVPKQLRAMLKNHPIKPCYKKLFHKLVAIGLKAFEDNADKECDVHKNRFLELSHDELKKVKIPKLRLK